VSGALGAGHQPAISGPRIAQVSQLFPDLHPSRSVLPAPAVIASLRMGRGLVARTLFRP
jgi:hypothetical protein